jgi:hypothetical protein
LSAFHSPGLWLAVTEIPPAKPSLMASICTVGVGTTPSTTGVQPTEARPATTADSTAGPLLRVSLPTATGPGPTISPNAAAKFIAVSGVSETPNTPLMPEPLTMGCFKGSSLRRADRWSRRTDSNR